MLFNFINTLLLILVEAQTHVKDAEKVYYHETEPEQADIFPCPEGWRPPPEGIVIKPETTTSTTTTDTLAPTTAPPSTSAMTTEPPTTRPPSTLPPTTLNPSTPIPTTLTRTTVGPTTVGPTTPFPTNYCFTTSSFVFDGPINEKLVALPMSPDKMNVQFLLFTCNNRDVPQTFTYLSPSSDWEDSNFDVTQNTRIIVHGWNGKYPLEWSVVSYNLIKKISKMIFNQA